MPNAEPEAERQELHPTILVNLRQLCSTVDDAVHEAVGIVELLNIRCGQLITTTLRPVTESIFDTTYFK